jgi:hypothetical protein
MPTQEDTTRLLEFIAASKTKGASDEFLAAFLTRRGWPADEVYSALGEHWQITTGLTIPERAGAGESARDAFLYLLSFLTLATWAAALGSMLFEFINHWFPDAVARPGIYNLRATVTWQMASIAVAFPVYLAVMRVIFREASGHPERLQSGVRRWLTYIALLGTAGTMIGDLICFLDYFLTGELTVRFVLKSVTVMAICGAIFAYYIGSLRWGRSTDVARERSRGTAFGLGASVVVIAAFCIGLGMAGTPFQQRRIEADRQRVQDLRGIAMAVKLWHDQGSGRPSGPSVPATLREIPANELVNLHLADPETEAPYEYHPHSAETYELCAVFSSSGSDDGFGVTYNPQFWNHGKGRTCFTLDASKAVPW